MPYATHIRATALGRLDGTDERFSYSVALDVELGPNSLGSWGLEAAALAEDFVSFHGSAGAVIHPKAVLEEVKFAQIGPDGKYLSDAVIVNVPNTPGGSTAPESAKVMVLPQAALAVSLVTERRGPTGKGRFYLPMPVLALGADLRMPLVDAETIRGAVADFLINLNNREGIDGLSSPRVVVASSKGYLTPVTDVRVGRVIDTMRSRRTSIPEGYTTVESVS